MAIPDSEKAFLDEFGAESDRAAAVLGGAYLDDLLAQAIAARLVTGGRRQGGRDLLKGPLFSFSNRVELSYGLGLIGALEAEDLGTINAIRNAFAHQLHGISFESDQITSLCAKFHCIQDVSTAVDKTTSRWIFNLAVVNYLVRLRKLGAATERTSEYVPENWPPIRLGREK